MANSQTEEVKAGEETVTAQSDQPAITVSETTVPKEEPKKLSPEEQADLERRRGQFRALYGAIEALDTYDAEAQLGELLAVITSDWERFQQKNKITDIAKEFGTEELAVKCFEAIKDATVQEAIAYITALGNALQKERYAKTKDIKVVDLGIKLL